MKRYKITALILLIIILSSCTQMDELLSSSQEITIDAGQSTSNEAPEILKESTDPTETSDAAEIDYSKFANDIGNNRPMRLQSVQVEEIIKSPGEETKKYLSYDQMNQLTYAPFGLNQHDANRHGVSLPVVDGNDDGYYVDGIQIVHPKAVALVNRNGISIQTGTDTKQYPDYVQPSDGSVWFYQDENQMTIFFGFYCSDGRPHETSLRILRLDCNTGDILKDVEKIEYGGIDDVKLHNEKYYILYSGEVGSYSVFVFKQENLELVTVEQGNANDNKVFRLEIRDGVFYLVYGDRERAAVRLLSKLPIE